MLHRHASPAVAGNYIIGGIAGAFVTMAGLFVLSGLVSPIPERIRLVLVIAPLILLALHLLRVLCLDLPQRTYQIPRETFHAAPPRAAFRFAFELGLGFRTYVTAISPYALVLVATFSMPAGLAAGAAAGASGAIGFGLGRSVVVASQALRKQPAVEHPERWLRIADGIALIAAAAFAVVS